MIRQHETVVEVFSFQTSKGVILCYVHDSLENAVKAFEMEVPCACVKVMYCNITSGKCSTEKVIFEVADKHDNVRVFNPTTLVTNLQIACPLNKL